MHARQAYLQQVEEAQAAQSPRRRRPVHLGLRASRVRLPSRRLPCPRTAQNGEGQLRGDHYRAGPRGEEEYAACSTRALRVTAARDDTASSPASGARARGRTGADAGRARERWRQGSQGRGTELGARSRGDPSPALPAVPLACPSSRKMLRLDYARVRAMRAFTRACCDPLPPTPRVRAVLRMATACPPLTGAPLLLDAVLLDAVQQQPGLLSRKRKAYDAQGEPQQPTAKARLAEPPQPNVKAKLVVPVAGAAKETGAAANRAREEAKEKAIPLADEKMEHARSKIAELERQLQESELRKSKALERLSEFAGQTKTYDSLHKRLVVLRFFPPSTHQAPLRLACTNLQK
jgi:hypothetical protein